MSNPQLDLPCLKCGAGNAYNHDPDCPNELRRALIRDLLHAKGGDDNLDARIHARNGLQGIGYGPGPHQKYTQNLHAARTLVPKGFLWGVDQHPPDEIFNPGGAQAYTRAGDAYSHCEAKTPELALCAAALMAESAIRHRPTTDSANG